MPCKTFFLKVSNHNSLKDSIYLLTDLSASERKHTSRGVGGEQQSKGAALPP